LNKQVSDMAVDEEEKRPRPSERPAAQCKTLRPRTREAKKRRPPYAGGFSVKNSHTSPRRVALRKNQTVALELRRNGYSFDEIAVRMKRPRATVHRWITDALEEMVQEPAQAVLKLELQRLDAYLAAYHANAIEGDIPATEIALKIIEKRCRLLGLFPKEGQHSPALAMKLGSTDDAPRIEIEFVLPDPRPALNEAPLRDVTPRLHPAPRRDYTEPDPGPMIDVERWSRLSKQDLRFDRWSICQG
jgi:hypothetical protein